jgi:hypothetical protein
VFLTGYTSGGIDRRYAHIPAFEKPINPQVLRSLFVERANDGSAVAAPRCNDWKMEARYRRIRRGGPSARPAGRRPAVAPPARSAGFARAGGPRARPYECGTVYS